MKKSLGFASVMCLGVGMVCGASVWAQGAGGGAGTTSPVPVLLWADGAPGALGTADADKPTMTPYLPATNPTKTAVIVAPGGGYGHLSMQKEGEDIARWLNARGVAAFVLKYRLGPKYHHPVEIGDAHRAIRMVRANAASYGIDATHVGIWGFSAGGHLAASAGTMYDSGEAGATDAVERQGSRPDFLILAYPVVTMTDPYVHKGSRTMLLGEGADAAQMEALSPEKHVTRQTPPAFIFSTTEDATVPVMNSVMFYSALVAAKVPAELHVYQHGPHGVGLAPGFPDLKGWPELVATWMRARGLMGAM